MGSTLSGIRDGFQNRCKKSDSKISEEAVWQDMIDNLYDFGVIKNKLKANEIFTNEFID